MNGNFKRIAPEELSRNAFDYMSKGGFLLTAGDAQGLNTMTAGWGALGVLFQKKVLFAFVRPTRHTFQFTEAQDTFSACFFREREKEILALCGTRSGRDCDKTLEAGLTPVMFDGTPAFAEAAEVMILRKIYADMLKPGCFIDPSIEASYPLKDYHKMYVGEIVAAYRRD